MKRSHLAVVAATWLLFGAPILAAESAANDPTATEEALTKPQVKQPATAKKKLKPFTPEDVKRGEANKKKLEWWEMPKPPVHELRSKGGSHAGH
jgi:hypothetical protein